MLYQGTIIAKNLHHYHSLVISARPDKRSVLYIFLFSFMDVIGWDEQLSIVIKKKSIGLYSDIFLLPELYQNHQLYLSCKSGYSFVFYCFIC